MEKRDIYRHKHSGNLIYILSFSSSHIRFIYQTWCEVNNFYIYGENSFNKFDDERFESFNDIYEYVGKAKISIEDVFKIGV